ncbi:MAG: hypothetical protein ABI451_03745 [Dokdonella sp.]
MSPRFVTSTSIVALVAALTSIAAIPALAADGDLALTIYRNDGGSLFEGGGSPVADGYAIVHERRTLQLHGGRESLTIDGLPTTVDAEAIALDLGSNRLLAQRVLSPGDGGTLAAHRGERIEITNATGGAVMSGILVGVDSNGLNLRDDTGAMRYLRDFAGVRFVEKTGQPGSTLQVVVDGTAGSAPTTLTYPTSGLGWRAAYSALVASGAACRLRLEALASIANRSGRDYVGSQLKLIAGEPNFAKPSGGGPMMMKAMSASAPQGDLPDQASLGDYRSFTVDGSLDLPDSSITQVPLYAPRDVDCQRTWLYESGGAWFPSKPMLTPDIGASGGSPVASTLRFVAPDTLPAGYMRVLTRDSDGRSEFIGEGRINDTTREHAVTLTLGTAFDLSAGRERTAFSVDRAAREMSEGFRISLGNSGDVARTITIREHPNRWRNWKLASSSAKPVKQTPDLLEFEINVPARGKATLDYAINYVWTAADE